MSDNFLSTGSIVLSKYSNFKLRGRSEELKAVMAILMRRSSNSLILAGAGGVGITALILGLQASKDDTDTPFDIVTKRFFWLETDALFASGDNAAINKSYQKILDILSKTPDSVLVVEDTRDFIEGARNAGSLHFINALTSMVRQNKTQVIFEVRDDDIRNVLNVHSDLRELFTKMNLKEPLSKALLEIVKDAAISLEEYHKIKILDEAITTAIEMTNDFRSPESSLARAQPDRAVTLLDRALAEYRRAAHSEPPKLTELEATLAKASDAEKPAIAAKIKEIQDKWVEKQEAVKTHFRLQRNGEKKILELEDELSKQLEKEKKLPKEDIEKSSNLLDDFEEVAEGGGFESDAVKAIRNKMIPVQAVIKSNREAFDEITRQIDAGLCLTREIVMRQYAEITGYNYDDLNKGDLEKLRNLEPNLKQFIFGQDTTIEQVADGVKVFKRGRRHTKKPLPYMFLGPSGSGKTQTALSLAQVLLGNESFLNVFDMSEYMEKNDVTKLIGAPPGYEGFEVGGILTNSVEKNPTQIILLDEIEKAHPAVFDVFLQILDRGVVKNNLGEPVYFDRVILIMTSNIGQIHMLNKELTREQQIALAMIDLEAHFRSEFLNRFNGRENICFFDAITPDVIRKIVTRSINTINTDYAVDNVAVKFSGEDLIRFCDDRFDPKMGARGLAGFITNKIETPIVNKLLDDDAFHGILQVRWNDSTLRLDWAESNLENIA